MFYIIQNLVIHCMKVIKTPSRDQFQFLETILIIFLFK